MTLTSFKVQATAVVGILIAFQLLAPAAHAHEVPGFPHDETPDRVVIPTFCDRVNAYAAQFDQRLSERGARLDEKRAERSENLEERRTRRDTRRTDNRSDGDVRREAALARLEERAVTDARKTALTEFKSEMADALKTRRAAVDAAQSKFRTDLDALIAARKLRVDAVAAEFRAAVHSAFTEAKLDCSNNVDGETVKADLRASLVAAQRAFQAARQELGNQSEATRAMIDARQSSLRTATDAFKSAVQRARTELRVAFEENR